MKDFFEVLKEYVPLWLTFITLAFGYLAYLYTKIFKQTNDLAEKQAKYLEGRVDATDKAVGIMEAIMNQQETDRIRLKETNAVLVKERQEKEQELLNLKSELDTLLKNQGVTLENLALGQKPDYSNGDTNAIDQLTQQMKELVQQIKTIVPNNISDNQLISNSQLTLAKAQMAKGNFSEAADSFEQYTSSKIASWEVYFSQAVNLANLREGQNSNLSSVNAYNDAINVLPENIDRNIRARIFGYRGAILKRLNRLDEAEADLNIARKYATEKYEVDDINYNLACVYALQGDKEKMLSSMYKIVDKKNFQSIQYHLDDYFIKFKEDKDFRSLLSSKLSTKTSG